MGIDYVEKNKSIDISRTHFMSREEVGQYGIGSYWYDGGDGTHVHVCRFEGEFYPIRDTMKIRPKAKARPIPNLESSRDR